MTRPIPLTRPLILAVVATLAAPAAADEGMWLPEQLPERADALRALGLELEPEALANLDEAPLGAVISLGGCSASFVSESGLVITNHHCAVGALQLNSDAENNLLQDGFIAETQADEIWAGPGSRVYVTEAMTDVTERVLGSVPEGADDAQRYAAIDNAEKALIAECEADDGYRCEVVSYYGGGAYRLIRQLEIEDVRLVYAPPESVGSYGGDTDNWMWPRHAGDFTFFRAYVDSDGRPAPTSPDNVPYRPARHLTVSTTGVVPGDYVMVAGYPGRTQRYATAREMAHAQSTRYPHSIATMVDVLGILEPIMDADPEAAVRLAPFSFGISNYLKNNRGMLDGFEASGAVSRVAEHERELVAWLDESRDRAGWYQAVEALDTVIAQAHATHEREVVLGWSMWGVDLLSAASTIHWLSVERRLDDAERDQGYQERDWPRIRERMQRVDRAYVEEADRALLAYLLHASTELPADQRIAAFDDLLVGHADADDPVSAAVEQLYAGTALGDLDYRLGLLEADRDEIESSDDPLLRLAVALYPLRRAERDIAERRSGAYTRLRPQYVEALTAFSGRSLYPDANGTLRVTYGQVQGYSPRDGVRYEPLTRLGGVVEKHTGEGEFDAPDALLAAIESDELGPYGSAALQSVAVNFLSTVDVTGGNSGSATFNARGELCGLLFDRNYEAVASDWLFDTALSRSIHVDVRYVLWTMDRVWPAHRLLREMGIEPAFVDE